MRTSENAFVAEVARYLMVEADDVRRMVEMDALPAFSIPKKTRPVLRIPLRDLHGWLMKRAKNSSSLQSYERFREAFNASRVKVGKLTEPNQ